MYDTVIIINHIYVPTKEHGLLQIVERLERGFVRQVAGLHYRPCQVLYELGSNVYLI